MAKRFTDSRKWDDPWFRRLPSEYKIVWIYLLDKCDHAGVYQVDIDSISFHIGKPYTEQAIIKAFNSKIQVVRPDKCFIPNFIKFQYGELEEVNRVHQSVINILKPLGAYKGLKRGIQGCKDKDKDKDKDKNKDKDFIKELSDNSSYAHIDNKKELGKMDAWLSAHPGRQKTKKFVINWLNKIEVPLKAEKRSKYHVR